MCSVGLLQKQTDTTLETCTPGFACLVMRAVVFQSLKPTRLVRYAFHIFGFTGHHACNFKYFFSHLHERGQRKCVF